MASRQTPRSGWLRRTGSAGPCRSPTVDAATGEGAPRGDARRAETARRMSTSSCSVPRSSKDLSPTRWWTVVAQRLPGAPRIALVDDSANVFRTMISVDEFYIDSDEPGQRPCPEPPRTVPHLAPAEPTTRRTCSPAAADAVKISTSRDPYSQAGQDARRPRSIIQPLSRGSKDTLNCRNDKRLINTIQHKAEFTSSPNAGHVAATGSRRPTQRTSLPIIDAEHGSPRTGLRTSATESPSQTDLILSGSHRAPVEQERGWRQSASPRPGPRRRLTRSS